MSASERIDSARPGAASRATLIGAAKLPDLRTYWSIAAATVCSGADKGAVLKSASITDTTEDAIPCLTCSSERIFATEPAPPALEKLTWTMVSDTSLR